MYKLINIFNAARLHIALVYGLIAITFVSAQGVSTSEIVAVLSFTSLMLATYLFNRIMDFDSDKISQPGEELEGGIVAFAVALLTLTPIAFLAIFSLPIWPYIVFLIIGMSYSLPIFFGKGSREILILKNVHAVGIWYISFILLQSVYSTAAPFLSSFLDSLHVFVLLYIYEIIWDIRDTHADRIAGVSTIPNTFGIVATRFVLMTLIIFVLWRLNFNMSNPIAVATAALLPISLIVTSKTPRWVFHMAVYIMLAALTVLVLW